MKFKDAKVGDKVWDVRYGWGVICNTCCSVNHPLNIQFKTGQTCSYTLEGRASLEHANSLLERTRLKQ